LLIEPGCKSTIFNRNTVLQIQYLRLKQEYDSSIYALIYNSRLINPPAAIASQPRVGHIQVARMLAAGDLFIQPLALLKAVTFSLYPLSFNL